MTEKTRARRVRRVVGWNLALTIGAFALVAVIAEVFLRATRPFNRLSTPHVVVPEVGWLFRPGAQVRWTNHLDFWNVTHANSLGFLDREPPAAERAARSCHVVFIGDSLVEAREVPIGEKFHVRLEQLAERELPGLNVTTSAFGKRNTGQIAQLPYYDHYARPLRPKLVVLFFVENDFENNHPVLHMWTGAEVGRMPFVTAMKDQDGTLRFRPPEPNPSGYKLGEPLQRKVWDVVAHWSYLASWLRGKYAVARPGRPANRERWLNAAKRHPRYGALILEWPATHPTVDQHLRDSAATGEPLLRPAADALEYTALALDEFKTRAERDGVTLAIFATHTMGGRADPVFERLRGMAQARDIPVINQHDWIVDQGADVKDAHWPHDKHWNPAGHRWAAQALLEFLRRNTEVCL